MSAPAALTDTHAHLTHPDYRGDAEVVERAAAQGVRRIINVGGDLVSSQRGADLAAADPRVWHAPGIHPHHAAEADDQVLRELRRLAGLPRAAAVGETGLDFYRDRAPRAAQVAAFRAHLRLAADLGLPVIVHSREAHDQVLAVLREGGATRGVMHCFSGDLDLAHRALDLGMHLGFAGPVTFHNAQRLREIVRQAPRDRVLLETDCPYLAPHPHRGQRNQPAYLPLIAQAVAECWGMTVDEVAEVTSVNAAACFPALAA